MGTLHFDCIYKKLALKHLGLKQKLSKSHASRAVIDVAFTFPFIFILFLFRVRVSKRSKS